MRVLVGLIVGLLFALVPTAFGHGTFEAQELELHVLNDEGTDTIELYGGYDITEVFLGSAYVPDLGDVVYVRLELYGQFTELNALMPWTVRVHYDSTDGVQTHALTTADGETFVHDFGGLEMDIDAAERSTHIQRAYLTKGSPQPGQPLTGLMVESFWGTDLRDVAPGGIPVPGTGGALDYVDPTAIEGQGRLLEAPVPPTTDAYLGDLSAHRNGTAYDLTVQNGLSSGGQHIHLAIQADAGWETTQATTQQVLEAGAAGIFAFTAMALTDTVAPLQLELTSDVGGRLNLELHSDGTLHARGAQIPTTTQAEPALESPSFGLPILLAALVGLAVVRRLAHSER